MVTIATQMLPAQIQRVHFSVLVMLATQGMAQIVKVGADKVFIPLKLEKESSVSVKNQYFLMRNPC